MNWLKVFNRLFEIINTEDETYFSGSKFINKVREIAPLNFSWIPCQTVKALSVEYMS